MKRGRSWGMVAAVLVLVAALAGRAHAVDPLTIAFTNKLSDASGRQVNPGTVYQGSALVLTNLVAIMADGVTTQALGAITVKIVYGSKTTTTVTNLADEVDNRFGTSITVPALSSFYIWTVLDNGALIYPKIIVATEPAP